jgi:hypothetical protein
MSMNNTSEDKRTATLPPLPKETYWFSDREVWDRIEETEYAKGNIRRHLMQMTSNEKAALFRAVTAIARKIYPVPPSLRELLLEAVSLLLSFGDDVRLQTRRVIGGINNHLDKPRMEMEPDKARVTLCEARALIEALWIRNPRIKEFLDATEYLRS